MVSLKEIPEFKILFIAAKKYIAGDLSICELNGTVGYLRALTRLSGSAAPLHSLLSEWEVMINRRWNEWGFEKEALTEEQFVLWLKEQLVFDCEAANNLSGSRLAALLDTDVMFRG